MTIAIMQPYFFPYVGYFSLIKHTDEFILFDPVQFIRHGWIERNRVLKQNEGWLYVQVPLIKGTRDVLIKDSLIDNSKGDWKGKMLAQLQPYKKIAPHYFKVIKLINEIFEGEYQSIVHLNKAVLEKTCQYLGMEKELPIFSEMNLEIEEPKAADEWALNISKAMGAKTYWNPPGGMDFFDKSKYDNAGIDLKFQKVALSEYNQKRTPFEAGLSIIDVMMFNSPEEINIMLDNFELV